MIDRQRFVTRLCDSGLLTVEELNRYESELPEQPSAERERIELLAEALVRDYRLTEFQVEILREERDDPLRIGSYHLLEIIGRGGMGVVYKAKPAGEHHLVAVKLLPDELTANDTAIRRFRREVQLASKLKHPNIVEAIDQGDDQGRQFFVMEFVDGFNLAALLERKPTLPILTAFDYVLDAAKGLAFAHEQGVIHRDIKPANLLVHREGVVKILDMGLARPFSPNTPVDDSSTVTELTQKGAVMGTADYMAPEQAMNSKNADARSDIYSLGCTLFYAFTGRTMFPGETMMEKIIAHRETPAPKLSSVREDVPQAVEQIYDKMIAKDPAKRYANAVELIDHMRECRDKFGHMWMIKRFISESKIR